MESKTILLGTTAAILIALVVTLGIYFFTPPTQVGTTLPNNSGTSPGPTSTISNLITGTTMLGPAYAQSATTTTGTEIHTLVVSGTGTASVQPDRAKIQMAVVTQAATAQQASALNADSFSALLTALTNAGIPKDQIETVQYNINPVYDYSNPNKSPIITGYQATHSIMVTVIPAQSSDLGKTTGTIIDAAVSAGVNNVNSIQFTVSNQAMTNLRDEALKGAVADASDKANVIAKALGVKILGVYQVSESSYLPQPIYAKATPSVVAGASTELVPGELTISASVSIVYQIGQ